MVFFTKRADSADERRRRIVELTVRAFADRGHEVTIDQDAHGPVLLEEGNRYSLANLVDRCEAEPQRRWPTLVTKHVEALITTEDSVPAEQLDAASLRQQIRARVVAERQFDAGWFGDYACPFAPGMLLVLCLDRPAAVDTLGAEQVAKLAVPLDELFRWGLSNTLGEPIEQTSVLRDRTTIVEGESLFIASKAAVFDALTATTIGPAPLGIVFGIPQRHALVYAVLERASFEADINAVMSFTHAMATGEFGPLQGGPLSARLYFWHDGVVDDIGGWNSERNALEVVPSDAFSAALQKLTEASD